MRYNIQWRFAYERGAHPALCHLEEGDNVDNQKVTVFRQKNKAGLTAAAIAGCLAVSPMLGAGVFLPQVLTTVPVLLLAMLGYAGPVSMAVCSGILAALC